MIIPLSRAILFAGLLIAGCNINDGSVASISGTTSHAPVPEAFKDYWYAGDAEINSYDLRQMRYGQNRTGDAVLVFVTEPFSKEKQVKLDYAEQAGADKVSVLKLNLMKKFHTGIYDYAIMHSVFTPVERAQFPNTLKTTFSSQDWCGQSFMQFNLEADENEYEVHQYSYFESEGDDEFELENVLLEDEIWNLIRINPAALPTGTVRAIPSAAFARLHKGAIEPTMARFTLHDDTTGVKRYTVEYMHFDRSLDFYFEADFPHTILRWTEQNGKEETTTATLKKSIKSAYWTKNAVEFHPLRDTLGLRF